MLRFAEYLELQDFRQTTAANYYRALRLISEHFGRDPLDLTEEDLHLANTADNVFLRDIPFEARSVSAHARLMAMARAQASETVAPKPAV